MTLSTGTTLQNGRYVIQAILKQDDLGTTYQATQALQNQPVVLQAVHAQQVDCMPQAGVLGDRPQIQAVTQPISTAPFDDRQQKFIEEVRRRFKAQLPAMAPIVDCFLENQTPFVVLSLPAGATPPDLSDWLSPIVVSTEVVSSPGTPGSPSGKTAALTDAAPPPPTAQSSMPFEGTTVVAMPLNVKTYQKDQPYLQGRSRSRKWLPIGLLTTALVAGVGGATMGWAIRTERIAQPGQTPLLEPLLNNDQSFPTLEGWPVNDPIYSSSPSRSERSSDLTPYGRNEDDQPTGQDYFPEPLPEWDSPPPPRRREATRPEYTDPNPDFPAMEQAPPVEVPDDPATAEVPVEPTNPPEKFKPEALEPAIPVEPPAIAPPPPAPEAPPAPDPVMPPPVTQ